MFIPISQERDAWVSNCSVQVLLSNHSIGHHLLVMHLLACSLRFKLKWLSCLRSQEFIVSTPLNENYFYIQFHILGASYIGMYCSLTLGVLFIP